MFLGVAAVVILTPGPDTAVVTKNALIHGRRAALGTSLGVNAGLLTWTLAAALGIASLVRASATAFTVLKLVGAAYLIWLGIKALRAASGHWSDPAVASGTEPRRVVGLVGGLRQGLFSNLANPKIAVFFTSLLPQFVGSGRNVFAPLLLLGGTFVLMTLVWLSGYAVLAARAATVLTRPRVRATLDRLSGVVMIGLGIRIAAERR